MTQILTGFVRCTKHGRFPTPLHKAADYAPATLQFPPATFFQSENPASCDLYAKSDILWLINCKIRHLAIYKSYGKVSHDLYIAKLETFYL